METNIDSAMMQTVRVVMKEASSEPSRNAIIIQIYPTCLNMGLRYPLTDKPMEIGRGETCDLRINHSSVSRRHVVIKPTPEGFRVVDQGSTNGTFLNNVQTAEALLQDGDTLRIGICLFRFLSGSNLEAEYHEEIYRLTIIDALTEIHNKRYLLETLDRELARAYRHHRPLALILFDLDHFKNINDKKGHLCGDYTLREVAARARSVVRQDELLARYGGEEFAVVVPETSQENALILAERIREIVGSESYQYDGEVYFITVSLGIAMSRPESNNNEGVEELIQRADDALYQAKDAGRNCVRVSGTDRLTTQES